MTFQLLKTSNLMSDAQYKLEPVFQAVNDVRTSDDVKSYVWYIKTTGYRAFNRLSKTSETATT
jgi:hypothetical protein